MKINEIGSEFWDVPTINQQNNLFAESTQWYLSGRCALQAIIKELGGARSISLPSWCCDSMIKPFVEAGWNVSFYAVYWQDGLIQKINKESDVLFLIDYFGYTGSAPDLVDYKGTVVRDVTHSIFSTGYSDADYFFGSLRKWCGVWTGGYAWRRDGHKLRVENADDFGYTLLRERAMQLKNSYIHGWGVKDKEYLKYFEEAENALEYAGIVSADYRDIELAGKMNVDFICSRRKANAEVLQNAFRDWLIFPELSPNDVPMFVPVLVPNGRRSELRHYLIKNEIYCPIHWPVSKYHKLDERERFIYENELSLVCDQRYTVDDMHRMAETIKVFMED